MLRRSGRWLAEGTGGGGGDIVLATGRRDGWLSSGRIGVSAALRRTRGRATARDEHP